MSCIFCDIINNQPDSLRYQDNQVVALEDIQAQAPTHLLIIPKKHIQTLNDLTKTDNPLLGHMIQVAQHLAKDHHIDQDGYRLIFNCNEHGGQTVFHIHLHLMGGRPMTWPPG